jgi:hypothetical protein
MILAFGYDEAILGVDTEYQRVVYSKQKMVDILTNDGMSEEEAVEFLEFNTWSAYVGESTPIFVHDMNIHDINEWFKNDLEN